MYIILESIDLAHAEMLVVEVSTRAARKKHEQNNVMGYKSWHLPHCFYYLFSEGWFCFAEAMLILFLQVLLFYILNNKSFNSTSQPEWKLGVGSNFQGFSLFTEDKDHAISGGPLRGRIWGCSRVEEVRKFRSINRFSWFLKTENSLVLSFLSLSQYLYMIVLTCMHRFTIQ